MDMFQMYDMFQIIDKYWNLGNNLPTIYDNLCIIKSYDYSMNNL